MIDMLTISGLQILAKIGVYAWEQQILQPLLLDLSIPLDVKHCDDDLANTVDYAELCRGITNLVTSKPYALIETVAEDVAQFVKTSYPMVEKLKITVSKPKAVSHAANVSISIER